MKKQDIINILCLGVILFGFYLAVVNLFWCAIGSTKATTFLDLLKCFILNKLALQMWLGIFLVIFSFLFLYLYYKKPKK
jgi:hypothetical protein